MRRSICRKLPRTNLALGILLLSSTAACTGHVEPSSGRTGEPPGTGPGGQSPRGPASGSPNAAAPATARRLSAIELRNAVADLFFGGKETVTHSFPDESAPHKFDSRDASLTFSSGFADALLEWSEAVGAAVAQNLSRLSPCDTAKAGEAACARNFIDSWGPRVFRAPLQADEAARFASLYAKARAVAGASHADAMAALIAVMLQSPQFLYRTELGSGSPAERARLTPHELASALSFFLQRTTPDDDLLAAAANGSLATEKELASQARRLLETARGEAALADFALQWMETPVVNRVAKDPKSYPDFGPALVGDMKLDVMALAQTAVASNDGVAALLTSPVGAPGAKLASLYGVKTTTGALPVDTRSGFLTRAAFLSGHLPPAGFSPVFIGRYVRQRILCQDLPDPPANVPAVDPPSEKVTTRQRFANHESNEGCAACHKFMDPVGFALERYDSLGTYRTTEGSVALTGEGELTGTDVDGKFTGALGLSQKLASSAQVKTCFIANLFEHALGRDFSLASDRNAADDETLETLVAEGKPTPTIQELALAIVTSDAFSFRNTSTVPGGSR